MIIHIPHCKCCRDSLYSVLVCLQSCWSNACDIGSQKSIGGVGRTYGVYSLQISKVLFIIMNSQQCLCVVYAPVSHCGHRFAGNTMGEVSFPAVLHWVTRVDDFTKLLLDTCERERVLHLQRNEESALTFLNWRKRPSDHYSVSEARSHISDYGCHLFLRPPIAVGPHSTND